MSGITHDYGNAPDTTHSTTDSAYRSDASRHEMDSIWVTSAPDQFAPSMIDSSHCVTIFGRIDVERLRLDLEKLETTVHIQNEHIAEQQSTLSIMHGNTAVLQEKVSSFSLTREVKIDVSWFV